MEKRFSFLALLACTAVSVLTSQSPSLSIQVDHPTAKVNPMFNGLMTEEINFSYDGGLYAELIRDRAIGSGWGALFYWTSITRGDSVANVALDEHTGPSTALPRSIKLTVTGASGAAPAGVQNEGYWGIAVRPNTAYKGSLYAKADAAGLPITASLVNDETGAVAASAVISGVSTDWKQYTFMLKTGQVPVTANNHFQLTIPKSATVWFNLVSLFPPAYHDRDNGFRIDIMEKMAAMHPKFLRFPGGNYLEGDHINERFDWKKTIGPLVDRPTHRSPWNYRSSDGMGLLEFLEWCEDLHMEPLLAVYAGYSLRQEHVDPGAALEPYVQDALDEIEYVTGDANTKWGAERAKNGHPAPFTLHYVEIGNEDEFDRSHSYDGRFAQFFKAIKEKYPNLQLIATTGVKSVKPDVIDEHFYMAAEKSFADWVHYDKYDRNGPKVFVGEWATREGEPTPNLESALGDAAWLIGLERNSDIVIMECYAPLFVNVNAGAMQWPSDLIGYDALNSYGSPSYWTQVMFAAHTGTEVVSSNLSNAGPRLAASATRDEQKRKVYIKVVNGTSASQRFQIALQGAEGVKHQATLVSMSAKSPNATNTISRPDNIKPAERMIQLTGPKFEYSFVPYSVNVMEISY